MWSTKRNVLKEIEGRHSFEGKSFSQEKIRVKFASVFITLSTTLFASFLRENLFNLQEF